jgi:hypothetical protein
VRIIKFPSAPPQYRGRTINPAAAFFKPEPFNGRNPHHAASWWQKLKGYLDLADVDDAACCSLLGLLLTDEAENGFNSLRTETQTTFNALAQAFDAQYILPLSTRFTMLADLRMRLQGCNESLRSYLTKAGAKLKVMNYSRELWLDFIYPTLQPTIQTLPTGFSSENGSFDSLLNDNERIERMAKTMNPTPLSTLSTNAFNSEIEHNNHAFLFQNSAVDDKLAYTEQRLAQMSLKNNTSKSVSDLTDIVARRPLNQIKNCFFCGEIGHVKLECFRFQDTISHKSSHPSQDTGFRRRGYGQRCHSRLRVSFTDDNNRHNYSQINYRRGDYGGYRNYSNSRDRSQSFNKFIYGTQNSSFNKNNSYDCSRSFRSDHDRIHSQHRTRNYRPRNTKKRFVDNNYSRNNSLDTSDNVLNPEN